MRVIDYRFARDGVSLKSKNPVGLIIKDSHLIFTLVEDYPKHLTSNRVSFERNNVLDAKPIKIRLRAFSFLRLGQVNDKHRVDFGLQEFPSDALPNLRLMEFLLTIPLPIVSLLSVTELKIELRVSAIKYAVKLIERNTCYLVGLEGKPEEKLENPELIIRNQRSDVGKEII